MAEATITITAKVAADEIDLEEIEQAVAWHSDGLALALILPDFDRKVKMDRQVQFS
jgi:hypothetical protein